MAEITLKKMVAGYGADLTQGSIRRHLVLFSVPLFLGNALQIGYGIVNALWVGNGLGANEMAALTVSFSVYYVLIAVAAGLTLATSILAAQAYGGKDFARLHRVVNNSVVLVGLISLICMAAGLFWSGELLALLHTPLSLVPAAQGYLKILLLATPFLFGMFLVASLLRGTGDSITPLYFQGAAIVITAILDPILMFGWLGFPRMGLNGTAYGTIFAHIVMLAALLIYIGKKKHVAAPDWRNLRMDRTTSLLTMKIGVPSALQQTLVAVATVAVIGLVNKFGSDSIAAYGITMRVDLLAMMPGSTIGMAVSTLAGQNIGARRFDRVRKVFWNGLFLSCGMTLAASLAAFIIPGFLMRLFVKDPEVIAIGTLYLRILAAGYLFFAVTYVSNGIINGSGNTFATTMFSLISLWVIRIPLAAWLSKLTGRVEAIWVSILISFAILTVISLVYYARGSWQKVIA